MALESSEAMLSGERAFVEAPIAESREREGEAGEEWFDATRAALIEELSISTRNSSLILGS